MHYFKSFQCLLESSLIVEYSRMQVPSLSSGCEIALFFVRHTAVTQRFVLDSEIFVWGAYNYIQTLPKPHTTPAARMRRKTRMKT